MRFRNRLDTVFRIAYGCLNVKGLATMRRCCRFQHFECIVSRVSCCDRNVRSARPKAESRHCANTTRSTGTRHTLPASSIVFVIFDPAAPIPANAYKRALK
jgi:hypothetical protein